MYESLSQKVTNSMIGGKKRMRVESHTAPTRPTNASRLGTNAAKNTGNQSNNT